MTKEVIESIIKSITNHLNNSISWLDGNRVSELLELLSGADRVYIVGVGKSGLVGKIFGLSLVSLGYEVYIVGESLLPAPRATDLIVAISGTGETDYPVKFAKVGKKTNTKVVAITSKPNSTLGKLADLVISIPGREENQQSRKLEELTAYGEHGTLKGMLFEMATLAFLNAVVAALARIRKNTEKEGNQ
ncbi:MAG: SIS domain-containing protein [Candidatus Odinarchaeota archaeon]|nr:SIS domain-containing protein [Candidatus Odinarchaeota archaeon]